MIFLKLFIKFLIILSYRTLQNVSFFQLVIFINYFTKEIIFKIYVYTYRHVTTINEKTIEHEFERDQGRVYVKV